MPIPITCMITWACDSPGCSNKVDLYTNISDNYLPARMPSGWTIMLNDIDLNKSKVICDKHLIKIRDVVREDIRR